MIRRFAVFGFGVCCSLQTHAFSCFLTMVKDSCWTNYDVSVTVKNTATNAPVAMITIPKDKSWAREEVTCQPMESFSMEASYSPVFWESDEGKVYPARREWLLPKEIEKGQTAWSLTVCYPAEFSEVPLPPDAKGNCACDTSVIPPVPPQPAAH